MGGAVSSGRDNDELIDNLMGSNYIRSRQVELVFRALDRADYMLPECREQAYRDLAWRSGPLHMSAPCIYSEVMENLELKPGMSFLNIGSGTGYLSTLVGLMLGPSGINHGVEVHPKVLEYANRKLDEFLQKNIAVDEFEFCVPKYFLGNALCLAPLQAGYDRVYCGAGCPEEYQNYMKQLIKVGGVLVMPLGDSLLAVRRDAAAEWSSRFVLSVSFASLRVPNKQEKMDPVKLDDITPPPLADLSRGVVRGVLRARVLAAHGELRAPPPPRPAPRCPRSICIPVDDDSDQEGLNELHDLDRAGGAHEMNALLSLVLSMGQNHVAGAIRFNPADSEPDDSSDSDREHDHNHDEDNSADNEPPRYPLRSRRRDIVADVIRRAAESNTNRSGAPLPLPRGRGRLSLTLEYNDPADDSRRDSSSPSDDSEADRPRKRPSTGSEAEAEPKEGNSQPKRQKFDSGLGDESGPSDESPQKDEDRSEQPSPASDAAEEEPAPRRRSGRRGRRGVRGRRGARGGRARSPPRDPRRQRLAALLRAAIRQLPLPRLYKLYLDFCRDHDF